MTIQFKLTKENGLTRRITFVAPPTWSALASRITNLYNIAVENIGVSYVDSDGDEVTLSSDDELQDLYASLLLANDGAVKFAVRDLGNLRAANTVSRSFSSAAPQQAPFRNTFGGHEVLPIIFDSEDEWQRLPGSLGSLFLSRDAPESPHAFVEVLESDVSKSEAVESAGGDVSRFDLTFAPAAVHNRDKGKGRAVTVEDDVSSADSVIGDEAPAKLPVHVFDMSSEDIFNFSPRSTVQLPQSGAATPAQAQSTPVIPEQPLKADVSTATEEPIKDALVDDPPLPSVLPDPDQSPSLVNDIATFLNTISTVITTHPELSERFRSILVNATNGTYWTTHRDAISRAAQDLHRTAVQETGKSLEELRRTTEQEANARVTEAVGRIFRTVGDFAQGDQANADSQGPGSANQPDGPSDMPRPPFSVVPSPPRFPPPPHPHFPWFGRPPFPPPGGSSWGRHPPPPPPPPPLPPAPFPRGWPRPPPPSFWGPGSTGGRATAEEVVTAAAEARTRVVEQQTNFRPSGCWGRDPEHPWSTGARATAAEIHAATTEALQTRAAEPQVQTIPYPPPSFWGRVPVSPGPKATAAESVAAAAEAQTRTDEQQTQSGPVEPVPTKERTTEELRAGVEKAKAEYKAQKERYRQAKANRKAVDEMRRDKESTLESLSRQTSDNPVQATPANNEPSVTPTPAPSTPTVVPTSAPGPESAKTTSEVHIVSNARGRYPQLEMFSVPRRSHTMGHVHRGNLQESKENRSLNRIMRKLSDMGFTESTYPNLVVKVTDQLLSHPIVNKDAEDDIVTNLIEELIPTGGGRAGSGDIPGAWH